MKVAVVGAGYVGLVSSVCLAEKGHRVCCVDKKAETVAQLATGRPHIFEWGLPELLERSIKAARLSFTTKLQDALSDTELVIVAVATPSKNGVLDLTQILEVVRDLGMYVKEHRRYLSIVIKSTVLPGTTDTIVRAEFVKHAGEGRSGFGLGMNPEFLREGDAIKDFMEPDRIVLGHDDERTLELLEELYSPWEVDKMRVNTRTAELIKYANNTLLATQVSVANEVANLAYSLGGIDPAQVMRGVQLDKRWNPIMDGRRVNPSILSYLAPGCGFGGSCFPKDLQALRSQGQDRGLPMHMLRAILDTNEAQPGQVVSELEAEVGDLTDMIVLLLGLAFKPGTDDVRESASLKIVQALISKNARVVLHDPVASLNFRSALGDHANSVRFSEDWKAELGTAAVIIVATAWPEYRELTGLSLAGKTIFDARGMFQSSDFATTSRYLTIGRRSL